MRVLIKKKLPVHFFMHKNWLQNSSNDGYHRKKTDFHIRTCCLRPTSSPLSVTAGGEDPCKAFLGSKKCKFFCTFLISRELVITVGRKGKAQAKTTLTILQANAADLQAFLCYSQVISDSLQVLLRIRK